MSTMIRSVGRLALAAFLLSLLFSMPALAHAEFRGSEPAQDSVLVAMPAAVSLRFSEQVGVLVLEWRLPDGSLHPATGEAGADVLTVQPPQDAGRGTYVLRWRVASADGHPVGGSLVFSVGEVTGAAPDVQSEPGSVPAVLARAAFVLALVLSVGAAVFHHAVAPLSARFAHLQSLIAGLVLPLGGLWIAVEGAERLGRGTEAIFSAAAMTAGLQSPVLFTVILAALAAPLVYGALQAGSQWAAALALGLAALSFAVSGHALSAPGGVAPLLTALHAGAIILWVGGLWPLAFAVQGADRLMVLRRFSGVALPAVVVLIGSGVALALLHRGSAGLLSSDWARLLAVKLALVAGMLALALWHRLRAMPRLASGTEVPVRRSVAVEAGLGMAVLMLAMGFRLAPPPSAAATLPDPVAIHIHTVQAMVDLAATAPFPGTTGFRLGIADADFIPFDPQEVTLSLTDKEAGIGPLSAPAVRMGPGLWEVEPMTLPTPGPWEVRITLLVTDFEQFRLTGTLPAPPEQSP
ncbi:copper resistance CopC/CopD family protein [Neotabrizicola shimadae]|uniref:Copper resistance protein CopC/CopD n=1 Tax=Neotabrizicola shimadae TaxID=2807096 RepID=A0A8G0ZSZ9_9RHOB|nr:CopD family protein [Neotabrizicola shimadae]QYZ69558.1 copper resistance protein CopC/CopD [Neotabrizicola shimadae]